MTELSVVIFGLFFSKCFSGLKPELAGDRAGEGIG